MGALRLSAPLAPLFAAVASVGGYVLAMPMTSIPSSDVPARALVFGVVVGGLAWVATILFAARLTSASSAQPRLYLELAHRYKNTRDRLAQLTPPGVQASVEARNSLLYSQRVLIGEENGPALRWALAYGYVSVLRAIHRAEQEIMVLEPREDLLGDIQHDELALSRSSIANRDILLANLASARTAFTANGSTSVWHGRSLARERAVEAEARLKAETVRRAIDQFRDDARDGIVRSRNQLLTLVLALGWLTFGMFGLAVLTDAAPIYLMSVLALYFVGVGAALAGRLRIGSRQRATAEDFGLGQVRLLATLLMAGLAAVGGVYLVAAFPSLFPAQGAQINPVPALSTIFDLRSNTAALLYAAIAGLVPETLMNFILRGTDKLQSDLATSRPANTEGAS